MDEIIKPLAKKKHTLRGHWNQQTTADMKELPDVLVISLERLPSHGKAIAEWMWAAKKRQHIPIVFVGGKHDKIEPFKANFPKAKFCSVAKLPDTIEKLTAQHNIHTPSSNP